MTMSTRELYEMATMDVLGLLDEDERHEFEIAFRAASPEIQSSLRREQRRQADIERLLPDVEQPVGLKARVMGAVRDAIASMSEPVATIGPVPARSWTNSVTVWRAACIGFATASVILAGFFYVTASQLREIDLTSRNTAAMQAFQEEYGPRFQAAMATGSMKQVAFSTPTRSTGKLTATLYIDPATNEAYLFGNHLPFGSGNYQLSIRSGHGDQIESRRFMEIPVSGGIFSLYIEQISPDDINSLAIEDPSRGPGAEPLMRVADTLWSLSDIAVHPRPPISRSAVFTWHSLPTRHLAVPSPRPCLQLRGQGSAAQAQAQGPASTAHPGLHRWWGCFVWQSLVSPQRRSRLRPSCGRPAACGMPA
ncbi:MAG: hypothetical protein KDA21_15480 [Phycisphaerales bacterium]|nr:hypothetical protein [Phycisphaerales bacterium]